ncbi:peptidoglycan endopeptidase [Gracilinema caldarium]|uniref:peptidoglycan endopeptidase n=1 Tax=Gracilinema caldarium TaxID=215591 RepID=UPI0026EC70DA|nr:peptidoglycan endopeptidase [Gracilinema caldarium]
MNILMNGQHRFITIYIVFVLTLGAPYRLLPESPSGSQGVAQFAAPSQQWDRGTEIAIEEAYRQCFKTYIIDGRIINVRLPFAENNERSELADTELFIQGGGKSNPADLWASIDDILATDDFHRYIQILQDGKEKVLIFDLSSRRWTWTRDLYEIARMKAQAYKGLPHRPYVLHNGQDVENSDIYNYLYCIGRLGMDCSGFVWHVLTYTARKAGVDLRSTVQKALKLSKKLDPSHFVGTWYFDSKRPELEQVPDNIKNLRSGDIILFRGSDGRAVHSAIIQSIDMQKGRIRYLQSTDEAPLDERGVHESWILFDPAKPDLSLKDPSLQWTQKRFPAFPGEKASAFSDDGERYRAFPEYGAGKVVRFKLMNSVFKTLNARYN